MDAPFVEGAFAVAVLASTEADAEEYIEAEEKEEEEARLLKLIVKASLAAPPQVPVRSPPG